jgi:hypothetical protein
MVIINRAEIPNCEDTHMADADDAKTLHTLQKTRHQLETVRNTPENIGSQQENRT